MNADDVLSRFQNLKTEKEVCDYLHVGRTTLWRMRKRGLPTIQFGGRLRFSEASLWKWFKTKQVHHYETPLDHIKALCDKASLGQRKKIKDWVRVQRLSKKAGQAKTNGYGPS